MSGCFSYAVFSSCNGLLKAHAKSNSAASILTPSGSAVRQRWQATGGGQANTRSTIGAVLWTRSRAATTVYAKASSKRKGKAATQKPKKRNRVKESSSSPNKSVDLPAYETSSACPCGKADQAYETCCEPFIYGDRLPETCEELMRSRYSALAMRETKYMVATTHPEHNEAKGISETELVQDVARTAKNCKFHKLVVLGSRPGDNPGEGIVDFRVWFKFVQYKGKKAVQDEEWQTLTESSTFKKENGRWLYVNGETDFTPMPFGDTSPIKGSAPSGPDGKLAQFFEKAVELDRQAKVAFGLDKAFEDVKTVAGQRLGSKDE
uniref:SEC-C motif domain protein n=1 Tax=Tetraselmis sp. GSL018 TaxID=582737 RepID=A0A061SNJ0_9CHLO|mmetsp:Transcript_6429/g.15482  ORF Transcript_6429/g.15482 Transcript_6429/m.15482 type:complete len:321 (-) Transcript_6429:161-1123(-)|eukprot:CAMPEP_0177579398 /NCGR_PEP_ID=MMETSP0419_2-20121207/931_1 /TAXON_ID=582737 /ORGANISM="Tetraselmis sp., Strain GSL018" /LENGTH=320 /DNA_ID=CAMNT_0019068047 /DNA_START=45 /DNA_END=1007 /DNA_ORIENTATION=-